MRKLHSMEAKRWAVPRLRLLCPLALQSARKTRQGPCPQLRKVARPVECSAGPASSCKELQLHQF